MGYITLNLYPRVLDALKIRLHLDNRHIDGTTVTSEIVRLLNGNNIRSYIKCACAEDAVRYCANDVFLGTEYNITVSADTSVLLSDTATKYNVSMCVLVNELIFVLLLRNKAIKSIIDGGKTYADIKESPFDCEPDEK